MIDRRGVACVVGVLAWATAIATTSLSASEPAGKPAVAAPDPAARLLDLGERYSPARWPRPVPITRDCALNRGDDARVRYALALVLIRQRCEQEAAELLGSIVAQQPDALYLWRAKIWAELAAAQGQRSVGRHPLGGRRIEQATSGGIVAGRRRRLARHVRVLGKSFPFLGRSPARRPADRRVAPRQATPVGRVGRRTN